ncbi:MAG TPA: hypothetical protein DCZ10_11225 [Pelotomaculum sp.]|nr:hypothetical protein [Pelotomaculum sp.]
MKKTKYLIITIISALALFLGAIIAYAIPGNIPPIPFKEDPNLIEFHKNAGKLIELKDVPVTIETLDGQVYQTTTDKFLKDKTEIEKKLKVKF